MKPKPERIEVHENGISITDWDVMSYEVGDESVFMDGNFDLEELKFIVQYMEDHQE